MSIMQSIIIIFILAYGLVIGSFLNVVIYRLPRGENLAYPGSHCPNCVAKLKMVDLIPVFSFMRTGGKCRYCKQKISIIYPSIEMLNAVLYLGIYFFKGLSIYSGVLMLTTSALICIAMIDLASHKIPNALNITIAVLALTMVFLGYTSPLSALIGAVLGSGILIGLNLLAKVLKAKAFGMGDVKYMLAMGAFFGVPDALYILWYTSIVAGGVILFNLVTRRWTSKTVFAFGPFLTIGTYIVMLIH